MKSKKIFDMCILLAGAVMIIVAGFHLVRTFMDYQGAKSEYDSLEEAYVSVSYPQEAGSEIQGTEDAEKEASPWYSMISVDMAAVHEVNSDVVGWIWFENEDISYPVLHSGDNETYLRTTFEGKKATAGSIFMDAMNSPDFSDYHTIIYGHNMKDLSMFGKLKFYRQQSDYYQDHAYFQIITEECRYRYEIFAYQQVSEVGYVYIVPMAPDDEYAAFLKQLQSDSLRDTGVEVTKEDKIITLSTCTSSDDRRFVVHAVLVGTWTAKSPKY